MQQPQGVGMMSDAERRQLFRDGMNSHPEVRAIAKEACEKHEVTEWEVDPNKYYCCKHIFEPKHGRYCNGFQMGEACWFSHHPSLVYNSEDQTESAAEIDRVWGEDPKMQLWVLAFASSDSAVFQFVTEKSGHPQIQVICKSMLESLKIQEGRLNK
jgi:hypothetical protein